MAVGSAVCPLIVPTSALGRGGDTAPSERIALGIIGLGDRGAIHIESLLPMPEVQIVAVCDPYRDKGFVRKRNIQGHYARTRGRTNDYKGCSAYQDFRELLAREDIDAVFIASPEHWHALHAAMALDAGKDAYGEKALTLTLGQGRTLCKRVRHLKRTFQVGMQQRSAAHFRSACELVSNGYLGKLHTIKVGVPGSLALPDAPARPIPPGFDYELWLGPAPYTPYNDYKCTFNWYFIYDYCVGWIQSWGVHHVDIAQWGAPELHNGRLEVKGSATFPDYGIANTSLSWSVNIRTEAGLRLHFADNTINEQGCRFEGDKGWIHVNRGGIKAQPASLLEAKIKPDEIHLYKSNNHHRNFFECMRTRGEPAAPVEEGHRANALTILADIATRLNRTLIWDWSTESFVDDEEANAMCDRPLRAPWIL
jgi:hypothetical protein